MCAAIIISSFLIEKERQRKEVLHRKRLRDCSNPLELPAQALNKEAFKVLLEELAPIAKRSNIPIILQLSTALRYFGQGSAQQMIAKDANLALGRSTVSKILKGMCNVLESVICPKWINFERSDEEIQESKLFFYDKYQLPGVIGCVDGTHIKIKSPSKDNHLFYNRKGYFSINAMIICDHLMKIISVNACRPGSCHDSFIWKQSAERQHLCANYRNGDKRSWLLGDGGYCLEPFLLTPYRSPELNTPEHNFNKRHASARNIVERVIGVLKSRFRCLLDTMSYSPQRAIQIINICCALHNICRHYNVDAVNYSELIVEDALEENVPDDSQVNELTLLNDATRIRNEIARSI